LNDLNTKTPKLNKNQQQSNTSTPSTGKHQSKSGAFSPSAGKHVSLPKAFTPKLQFKQNTSIASTGKQSKHNTLKNILNKAAGERKSSTPSSLKSFLSTCH